MAVSGISRIRCTRSLFAHWMKSPMVHTWSIKSCLPLGPHLPPTSLPDMTVPGSYHISPHLRTFALAVLSAWNVSRLSPLTPFFDLCMFLFFLSFRFNYHLLREAFPDSLCKADSQTLYLYYIFIAFINNWNDIISVYCLSSPPVMTAP